MEKLKSTFYSTVFILFFIVCEFVIHYLLNHVELSGAAAATVTLNMVAWICGAGAVMEVVDTAASRGGSTKFVGAIRFSMMLQDNATMKIICQSVKTPAAAVLSFFARKRKRILSAAVQ